MRGITEQFYLGYEKILVVASGRCHDTTTTGYVNAGVTKRDDQEMEHHVDEQADDVRSHSRVLASPV